MLQGQNKSNPGRPRCTVNYQGKLKVTLIVGVIQ